MPMLRTRDVLSGCAVPAVDAPVAGPATPRWPTADRAGCCGAEAVR